jgi:hypothetical protein
MERVPSPVFMAVCTNKANWWRSLKWEVGSVKRTEPFASRGQRGPGAARSRQTKPIPAKPDRQPGPIVRNKPNWARGQGIRGRPAVGPVVQQRQLAVVPGESRSGATGDKRKLGGDARTTKKRLTASLRSRRPAPRAKQSQFGPVATGWGRRRSYSISVASPCLRRSRLWPRGDDPTKQSQFQRGSQVGSVKFQAKGAKRRMLRVFRLQTSHFKLAARETQVTTEKGLMTTWAQEKPRQNKAKSPLHRMVLAV